MQNKMKDEYKWFGYGLIILQILIVIGASAILFYYL